MRGTGQKQISSGNWFWPVPRTRNRKRCAV